MFNKLKHLKDLRSQAKQMQNALSGEKVTIEKKGIIIEMNGNMEVIKITLPEDITKEKQEKVLIECFNEAIKKTQRLMAQKMQEIGGFPGMG